MDTLALLKSEFEVGGDKRLFFDGALVATNSYAGEMRLDQIGRLFMGGSKMGGKLAELILYNRIPTLAESSFIYNYLINKWGPRPFPIDFSDDFSFDFS